MKKIGITLSNGEQYFYLDSQVGKETIILLHGNMSSGVHYSPIFDTLAKNYRVIAPDLRGFGDSSYKTRITSLKDLADDILDFTNLLSIDTFYLGGWSTGGAIALSIAQKAPDKVKKLILIESASFRGYPIFKKDEKGAPIMGEYYDNIDDMAQDAVQVAPMVAVMETKNFAVMDAVWKQAIYTVNQPNEEDNTLYINETLKQRNLVDIDWALTTFNMSNFTNGVSLGDANIQEVTCPVLSLWSEKDVVVLEYMVDETVEALKDVQKIVLKNSGHSPLVDCPVELTNNILNFIK